MNSKAGRADHSGSVASCLFLIFLDSPVSLLPSLSMPRLFSHRPIVMRGHSKEPYLCCWGTVARLTLSHSIIGYVLVLQFLTLICSSRPQKPTKPPTATFCGTSDLEGDLVHLSDCDSSCVSLGHSSLSANQFIFITCSAAPVLQF
jgi:hypothetical protein